MSAEQQSDAPQTWWTPGGARVTSTSQPGRPSSGLAVEVTSAPSSARAVPAAPTAEEVRPASFGASVAIAAGIAALGVAAPLGIIWALGDPAVMEWAWTTIGPDYYHSPADIQAERVCDVQDTAHYDQFRCVIRLQGYTDDTALHFPKDQGGTCELVTRFECAKKYHFEQWTQDVPLLQPWWLHNGPAGMAFSGTAGGIIGLVGAGAAIGMGGRTVRRFRFVAASAAAGAGGGLVLMDLIRHQDMLAGLPGWTGLALAGPAAVAALAAAGSMRATIRRRAAEEAQQAAEAEAEVAS